MPRPELVVLVADLDRGAKQVTFPLSDAWLRRALEGSGAEPVAPGELSVDVSKSGKQVMVRGKLAASLQMPCVVTLDPVPVQVTTEVFLMLSQAPSAPSEQDLRRMARKQEQRALAAAKNPTAAAKAAAPKTGKAPQKSDGGWTDSGELSDELAGQDTFEGHEIVLDDFAREFLLLELPMFPRRSDLPTDDLPANPPPSEKSEPAGDPIDPRLSPLADLKRRLEQQKNSKE